MAASATAIAALRSLLLIRGASSSPKPAGAPVNRRGQASKTYPPGRNATCWDFRLQLGTVRTAGVRLRLENGGPDGVVDAISPQPSRAPSVPRFAHEYALTLRV